MYVEGNPINFSDPSGHDPREGQIIHQMIQGHYLRNYALGRFVQPEFEIDGASKKGTGYKGYADIADITLQQIYEIKPILGEDLGLEELNWYLSFLPGWTPGINYPSTPVRIGKWPGDPTRDVYAQMRKTGVIVYWGRRSLDFDPMPVPIPLTQSERNKQKNKIRIEFGELIPGLAIACEVTIVAGVTIIIVIDGVPGDEAIIPLLWSSLAR